VNTAPRAAASAAVGATLPAGTAPASCSEGIRELLRRFTEVTDLGHHRSQSSSHEAGNDDLTAKPSELVAPLGDAEHDAITGIDVEVPALPEPHHHPPREPGELPGDHPPGDLLIEATVT
jgi:hypothetical protein